MAEPEQFPVGLTRRMREVVGVVRYRNAPPGSPCYLVEEPTSPSGTADLWVPVLYGDPNGPDGPLHEMLWRLTWHTIRECLRSEAIALGTVRHSGDLRGMLPGRGATPVVVGPWRAS